MQADDRVTRARLDVGDAHTVNVDAACRPWSTGWPPRWSDRRVRRHGHIRSFSSESSLPTIEPHPCGPVTLAWRSSHLDSHSQILIYHSTSCISLLRGNVASRATLVRRPGSLVTAVGPL